MKNYKNLCIVFVFLLLSTIIVSCNKNGFTATPLEDVDTSLYQPRDPETEGVGFKIYSWIRYNNTPGIVNYDTTNFVLTVNDPDLSSYGIHPFFIVNPIWIFDSTPGPVDSDKNLTRGVINREKIRGIASAVSKYPNRYVQIDAEAWSTTLGNVTTSRPLGNVSSTRDSLAKTIRVFREFNTTSKIGFYGMLPVNKFRWANINGTGSNSRVTWEQQNDSLQAIYDQVDAFFPSCYTRESMADSAEWRKYTIACIDEIKRLDKTGKKPIFIGLTLQYGNGGTGTENKFVEPEYLQYQLETLLNDGRVQGVYYWTSNKAEDGTTTLQFSTNMEWLKTIYQFVKTKNLQ